MVIQSSEIPVAHTGPIRADQINRLHEDIIRNHAHVNNQIDHDNMVETKVMPGLSVKHSDADTHISAGGAFSDSPGGAQGVHGLLSTQYVAGIFKGYSLVIQWGVIADSDPGWREREWPVGSGNYESRNRFTFPQAFDEPPDICFVIVNEANSATHSVYQQLKTSFAFKIRWPDYNTVERATGVHPNVLCLAIGKVAP